MERTSKRPKHRSKHLKTEAFQQSQSIPFEFGKPVVRLPLIAKKSGAFRFRYDTSADRSLDSKDKRQHNKIITQQKEFKINTQESILRKYSNNSQLQLLSFEQLQLCADKSKKILPKIAMIGAHSRQNTQRLINQDFHKRLNRIKSQKKIDSGRSQICSYKIGAVLGRGNYSIVKLCQTNQGQKYAVKIYPKLKINTLQRQLNLKEQINVMKSLSHKNIIAFREHVETDENHYLIMQLFDNISLLEFLKRQEGEESGNGNKSIQSKGKQKIKLSETTAKLVMKEILEAFQYIHNKGIAHRDIKLENVLISSANKEQIRVKVIDFGFSCRCVTKKEGYEEIKENKNNSKKKQLPASSQQHTFNDYCGTPSYMAPQITTKKQYKARPADIWALGVLLFYLVVGSFPFKNLTDKSQFSVAMLCDFGVKLSDGLVSLLKSMLKNNPMQRLTVDQLVSERWMNEE